MLSSKEILFIISLVWTLRRLWNKKIILNIRYGGSCSNTRYLLRHSICISFTLSVWNFQICEERWVSFHWKYCLMNIDYCISVDLMINIVEFMFSEVCSDQFIKLDKPPRKMLASICETQYMIVRHQTEGNYKACSKLNIW